MTLLRLDTWRVPLAAAAWLATMPLAAQTPPPAAGAQVHNTAPPDKTAQVVAGGQVPDEATRAAIVGALRQVYGAANVVDQIEVVGSLGAPANWSANVQKLIDPALKKIHRGQLQVEGTQVMLQGEVADESQRQAIVNDMAGALNPTYTIRNALRVPAASEQGAIDQLIGNRIIEFELGSATLTRKGRDLLDEVAPALLRLGMSPVAIIGHTDNVGSRASNLALSQARAESVKGYLVGKGVDPALLSISGAGPDQPVAGNDTDAGRARNRRIEFRVGKS